MRPLGRPASNFLLDFASLLSLLVLIGTGIVMEWVLPAGRGHGRFFWGWNRHEWGEVHFWVSLAFVAMMALHLLLHWKWILCVIRTKVRPGRFAALSLASVAVLALTAAAFWQVGNSRTLKGSRAGEPAGLRESSASHATQQRLNTPPKPRGAEFHQTFGVSPGEESIRGSMTLAEVESLSGVPVATLLRELRLPAGTSREAKLGHLRRQHGFHLSAVRAAVAKHGQ